MAFTRRMSTLWRGAPAISILRGRLTVWAVFGSVPWRCLYLIALITFAIPGQAADGGAVTAIAHEPASVAAHGPLKNAVFAPVTPDHPLTFPADTGSHPGFRTEWWYATGWLNTPDGKPLGFQITFFRSATGHDASDPSAFAPTQLIIAHAALSNPGFGRLMHDQKIARQGFGLAYATTGNTDVKLDAWHLVRAADGHYTVTVNASDFTLNLSLTPTQAPMLQGDKGYSQKGPLPAQASYYYSEPQLRVSGTVTTIADSTGGGALRSAVAGTAWLDHEWSSTLLSPDSVGWEWLGANLSDGSALMAFRIRGRDGGKIWAHATLRDAQGRTTSFEKNDVDFAPLRMWRSPRTDVSYPVSEKVRAGANEWRLDPLMDDQELDSRQSTGAVYWEGAATVTQGGKAVGHGYLELTGYGGALGAGF
jgi:predicted secreted hydrolase